MYRLYIYERGSKLLGFSKCLIHTARFLHRCEALDAKREFYRKYMEYNIYDHSSKYLSYSIKEEND